MRHETDLQRGRRRSGRYRDEEGSSLVETALLMPVLLLLLTAAIDFGRAYSACITVNSAAAAGALYGIQNPGDATGMVLATKLAGADLVTLVPVASYGCECGDGTGASALCAKAPTCSSNVVNYVEVDTTATFLPLLRYAGLTSSIALTGKARMRAAQ